MLDGTLRDFDHNAFKRLAPILGGPGCTESWREGFLRLDCREARPGGDSQELFGPADVVDVVAAACSRVSGGSGNAVLRLVDDRWAAMCITTVESVSDWWVSSQGYVSDRLSEVVLFGLDNDARDSLGIPNNVDRALGWVKMVERRQLTPRSVVLRMLGGPDIWREVLDELAFVHVNDEYGHRSPFGPMDILGVIAVGREEPRLGRTGWAVAVLRLRDRQGAKLTRTRWACLEAEVELDDGLSADDYSIRLAKEPYSSASLAHTAWKGISDTSRRALGLPDTPEEFRAWASLVEQGYPATAHGHWP